jgi:hypothetical protein
MFLLFRWGGGSEARSNAEDSRSAFDEPSSPVGVRRFDSCPPHHHIVFWCANFYMKSILTTYGVEKNGTKTVDNVKLEVLSKANSTLFSWSLSFNGADFSSLDLKFHDGHLSEFRDDRSHYKIGGTDVNIDKQEAVTIALKTVDGLSWSVDGKKVTDFEIVEKCIRAELLTRSRKPLELYPYWLVNLPLDDVYPGEVYAITVLIWADTSEILDCYTKGFGGDLSIPLELSPASEQQLTGETFSTEIIITVVVLVIIVSMVMSRFIIKKRRE